MKGDIVRLSVANGALLEVPLYRDRYRASNWLAVIDVDGTAPGGLARRFINRGKGECFYLIEQVALFDAVEFAADYTTSVGAKRPERWYGVVVAKTDDHLLIEECEKGVAAVVRAKAARVSKEDRLKAVRSEVVALKTRAELLENEARAIEAEDGFSNALAEGIRGAISKGGES